MDDLDKMLDNFDVVIFKEGYTGHYSYKVELWRDNSLVTDTIGADLSLTLKAAARLAMFELEM